MESEKINEMLNDILDKLREFARSNDLRLWVEVTNEDEHYFMFTPYDDSIVDMEKCLYMIVPEELTDADDAARAIIDDVTEKFLTGSYFKHVVCGKH